MLIYKILQRGHQALWAAERGADGFTKFRWWLADRIRPIPVNDVIRDRDEARRFGWNTESDGTALGDEAQKAMDAFTRLQDDAQMLDVWRRDQDYDMYWDVEDQRLRSCPA